MRSLGHLVRPLMGKGLLFSMILAAVVAGSSTGAMAQDNQDTQNPGVNGDPGTSAPEINSSGIGALAVVLLGAVALIAESKARPARQS